MRLGSPIRDLPPTPAAPPAGSGRVTLADVARRCGVSKTAVSFALNRPADRSGLSADTRRTILDASEQMGYRPNLVARALTNRRTNLISILRHDAGLYDGVTMNATVQAVMISALHYRGYDVGTFMPRQRHGSDLLSGWQSDGAIVLSVSDDASLHHLRRSGMPVVSVNGARADWCPSVRLDDRDGMRQAVLHLHGLGHRRIAYANVVPLTDFPHYSVRQRHESYLATLADLGLAPVPGHEEQAAHTTDMPALAPSLWRRLVTEGRATAVIVYDHIRATQLLSAAPAAGVRVPADCSLMCFNDEMPIALLNPPLTAVAVSDEALGRLAVDLLHGQIETGALPAEKDVVLKPRLVPRASTAPPPVGR